MPRVNRQIAHIIAPNHITVAAMGSVSPIRSFPLQTDQGAGIPAWAAPSYPKGTTFPMVARLRTTLGGAKLPDGAYRWRWVFDKWTLGMYTYWMTQFLSSGVWYAPVTVRAYTEQDIAIYLQAYIWRPAYEQEMKWLQGGYQEVVFEFTQGTVIT